MEEQVTITLNDLQIIVNMIDVCTKRGAFEGSELLTVGQVREKVASVIKLNTPAPVEEAKEEETVE
jgi:hypothetical protein